MMLVDRHGWNFEVDDAALLEPWLADLATAADRGLVKRNSERDVFTVSAAGRNLHVKHAHPSSLPQKIRAFFSPKLAREYRSAVFLEKSGVPIVRHLGWGRKGFDSILITDTAPHAVDAKKYWFAKAAKAPELKREFLFALADLLSKLVSAGAEHPDLHPGNILVSERGNDSRDLLLVDLYGVRKSTRPLESLFRNTVALVAAFRGELTDAEAVAFIEDSAAKIANSLKFDAKALWRSILEREAAKTAELWRKRESKVFSDPRYSRTFVLADGARCRVRTTPVGEPFLEWEEVERILSGSNDATRIAREKVSADEARGRWIQSSRLELYRLPHRRVLAWLEREDGGNELLVERSVDSVLSEDEIRGRYGYCFPDSRNEFPSP